MAVPRLAPSPNFMSSQPEPFEKELVRLKVLVQETLEESRSRLHNLENGQEPDIRKDQRNELLADIKRGASDVAQLAEQKCCSLTSDETNAALLSEGSQKMHENHQKMLAATYKMFQDLAQDQRRRHSELLTFIKEQYTENR